MSCTTQVELPPMSKHHVLHLAAVAPDMPVHLVKSLLVLARHADHQTGLSRPGQGVVESWGIPYSTWHRHMQQLGKLGLVRQTVKGCKEKGLAATYELLYVLPLTSESASASSTSTSPSPHRGGGATSEKGRANVDPDLTDVEAEMWCALRAKLLDGLSRGEYERLNDGLAHFDRLTRLRRTCVRLVARGAERELVETLTRTKGSGRPAYEGARSIAASMWSRVRRLADDYGYDMADPTPVGRPAPLPAPEPDAVSRLEGQVGRQGLFRALTEGPAGWTPRDDSSDVSGPESP